MPGSYLSIISPSPSRSGKHATERGALSERSVIGIVIGSTVAPYSPWVHPTARGYALGSLNLARGYAVFTNPWVRKLKVFDLGWVVRRLDYCTPDGTGLAADILGPDLVLASSPTTFHPLSDSTKCNHFTTILPPRHTNVQSPFSLCGLSLLTQGEARYRILIYRRIMSGVDFKFCTFISFSMFEASHHLWKW